MAINLATKYADKTADTFYEDSVVVGNTNRDYKWDGVKSVVVYTPTTIAPTDYTRTGTSRYGTTNEVQDTIQTMSITQDKAVSLAVDKGNNTEQMMVKNAGKITRLEIREQFIPMFDKYCLSTWATNAGGHGVDASLTKSNIVEAVTKGWTALRNASAINGDIILYIGATNYAKLLNAPEFLGLDKLGEKALAKGQVGEVNGLRVVVIPDTYLPTVGGAAANFLVVNKASVLAPTKIKDMKLHIDPPGISGNLMEIRWLYDAFVLKAKESGVYVSYVKEPTA